MFDFRTRTTSNDSSSDQSQAPLTPLPGRLSLRPNRSPSPPSIENPVDDRRDLDSEPSLFRRPSGDFEELAELGGATFAELLGRGDVRDSVVLHASDLGMGAGSKQAAQHLQEEEVILTLPGGGWGVTGPDAHLLLQELHRARISTAQKRRRRIGYFAGVTTLVFFGLDFWLLVATNTSIVRFGGTGRGVLRWIEFSSYLLILPLVLLVIGFLRTRRPSTLGMLALVSTSFCAFLQITLSLANFILSFVWKRPLSMSDRSWAVDVAWTNLDPANAAAVESGSKAWTIAMVVRFFVAVAISLVWLYSVRLYNAAIHTPFVISPHALPSSELRALLGQHRATIIPLAAASHPASAHNSHSPDWLPPHLDRAHYVQASEASAAYSYVSHHMRSSSAQEEISGKTSGVSTWARSKLWEGVGWLFGVQAFEEEEKGRYPGDELAEKRTGRGVQEEGVPSLSRGDGMEEDRQHDFDRPSFDIASSGVHPDSKLPTPASEGLLGRLFSSKRLSTGSTAPLLPSSHTEEEFLDTTEPPPPVPSKDPRHGVSRTGSSGSSLGQVVYVRMSDGKLVRRLSTIASESSIRRSRSDLSGSYQTGDSGPDSFKTARSNEGTELEILASETAPHQ
ncbi:hypothetical protein JCM16303_002870 [Sporobolomyces ruberrimus]